MLLVQREVVQLVHKVISSGKILAVSRLLVQSLGVQLRGDKDRKVGALCFSRLPFVRLSPSL